MKNDKTLISTNEVIELCKNHGISPKEFFEYSLAGKINPVIFDKKTGKVTNAKLIDVDDENNLLIEEIVEH